MASTKDGVYDVLVIGGGIAGLSTAFHLARQGKRVALYDQAKLTTSASFNSTAITSHDFDPDWYAIIRVFGEDAAKQLWQLSERAFEHLADFASTASPRFKTRRIPAIIYSTSPEDDEALRTRYELYRRIGAEVEFVEDGSTLHRNFRTVLTVKSEGESNNQAILKALARAFRGLGGKIFTDSRVLDVVGRPDGVSIKLEDGTMHEGRIAVVATGDNGLLKEVPLPVTTRRTFVVQFEKKGIPDLFKNAVLWDNVTPYHYLRSFRGNTMWIGGEDIEESDYDPSKEYYAPLETYARTVLGWDESYKRTGEWSGTFYSSDIGLPYIGPTEMPSVYVNLAFGDTGVLLSFLSGYLFSAWMEGKEKEYEKYFSIHRPQ